MPRKKVIKFEDALKRLEEIAGIMENNDLTLDESMKVFQEGVELAKICHQKLDEAEKKISVLTKGNDGELREEEFYTEEE